MSPTEPDLLTAARALGTALAIGLFVGLERGWREREVREGGRVAGLRTFALIGLMGGVLALVAEASVLLLGVGLACIAALFAVTFRRAAKDSGTVSITSAVAALVTFALGALAAQGQEVLAVAAAVVVTLLLGMKDVLHRWLRRIQPAELNAVLQLAVLSAVVLPLLPDEGLGPYGAVNPFKVWLAVVLVAALALAGHFAVRLRGERQGLLWAGLLGGLASSTAATVTLSRHVRQQAALAPAASAAIVAACGMMFIRMATVVALLQPDLALRLGGLLAWLGLACFAVAAWQWRVARDGESAPVPPQARLFDLSTALGFGLALAVVAVASRAAREALGNAGLYGVAFLSGLADVDAILISSVQMHASGELPAGPTAGVMLVAAFSNMVMKAGLAWGLGGRAVGARVTAAYLAVLAAGVAGAGAVLLALRG
ncbi:MgtC/SapB family protein [Ramlibacter sp. MAHUQ-53]|uniref:MgtC/SapB family protein n=1 Tax=unclassified Ramlibacter TaxID=2617605 RepID=UPI003638E6B5